MASAATAPIIRRIPPPRVYAAITRRRSTTETKQNFVYDSEHDHEKCLNEENELREINRRQLIRIQLLEGDYKQLDDDIVQVQNERDLLLKQKRLLEEELERSSYHASANVDLHVYTQKLENDCRDLRCQIAIRDKEKVELNETIADLELQIKQAHDQQEEWRDAYNELETLLTTETENRQCIEIQLKETNQRQKENENQICRLQNDLEEMISSKQEIIKSNYILVQNAEALREQLRTVRTQAAEVQIICASSSTSFDNLDESLPCLVYDNDGDEDTPDGEKLHNLSENCQSSLFSEINSLETMTTETITKCLSSTTNDIELDLLLAKTTTLSSSLSLINQLIGEIKYLQEVFVEQNGCRLEKEQERLSNMKVLLKRVLENTQVFDTRFRKLQLLLIASREQQQCHQAELDDFFRLVDKRLLSNIEGSTNDQPRLVSILEAYEHELERLRQIIRTNDETVRLSERQLVEQQNITSRCRIKTTFLEKNQRKLIEKIKELNTERRQWIESSSSQKRTRRRVVVAPAAIPSEQQDKKSLPSLPSIQTEPANPPRLRHSRSLPCLKSFKDGRKSRNDSGVVLNDEIPPIQPLPNLYNRRRIKTNTTNQFVMHTSSHVCVQSTNNNINTNSKHSLNPSYRFPWFFLLSVIIIIICLSFTYVHVK